MKFYLTNKAKSDFIDIGIYTQEKWGKHKRNSYLKDIDNCFSLLLDNQELGAECNHIKIGYRKYQVNRHVIFYRIINASTIEITRILHQAMEPKFYF